MSERKVIWMPWEGHNARILAERARPKRCFGWSWRDPDRWQPLIFSFQQFYGLRPGRLQESELAKIPESQYRP